MASGKQSKLDAPRSPHEFWARQFVELSKALWDIGAKWGQTKYERPEPHDLERLFEKFHVDAATEWLIVAFSLDVGEDFSRRLLRLLRRYQRLTFRARQFLDDDFWDARKKVRAHRDSIRRAYRRLETELSLVQRPPGICPEEAHIRKLTEDFENAEGTFVNKVFATARWLVLKAKAIASVAPKIERPPAADPLTERNAWLYEKACDPDLSWTDILTTLQKRLCNRQFANWRPLGNADSVRKAVNDHAKKFALHLPERAPGRPPKK